MSRQLSDSFHTTKNALHALEDMIWLYEINVPPAAGETDDRVVRITNHTEAFEYGTTSLGDPIVFDPFPVTNGEIRSAQSGDIVAIRVTVGNATREVGELVDEFRGLIDQRVVIRVIDPGDAANPQAVIPWRSRIADATLTLNAVAFELRPTRLERAQVPGQRYSAVGCRFAFGGARCGYVIPSSPGDTVGTGFSTCPRTESGCTDRGLDEESRGLTNQHPHPRWGGYKGIPRR